MEDSGLYTLRIKNEHGEKTCDANILVKGLAPKSALPVCSNSDHRSMTPRPKPKPMSADPVGGSVRPGLFLIGIEHRIIQV